MDISKISHRAYFNDCYPINNEEIKLSITTGKDINDILVYVGDPFDVGHNKNNDDWSYTRMQMKIERELPDRNIWSTVIRPQFRRLKYHFEFICGDEHISLAEDGFHKGYYGFSENNSVDRFIFPWINPSDVCKTPDWVRDTIWYQIFPDRFSRGNMGYKRHNPKEWRTEDDTTWHDFYGGDIRGIINRLSYIADLGYTGIYLNPITLSNSNHKYDVINYYEVDPDFGTNDEVRELVDKAHALGIKVMIDAVFNHTSNENPMWQDVLGKGPESEFYSWYFIHKWPVENNVHASYKGYYDTFSFMDHMPKLNTNNPKVMDYLIGVVKHWVLEWKIDGIRYDVGNEVSHAFLKKMRNVVKELKPDVYMLGEIWQDSFPWLMGDEYDSVMNYTILSRIHGFFDDRGQTSKEFMYGINKCYSMYYEQVNKVLFNILDSHDTDRLLDRCQGDRNIEIAKLAILMTMEGSPCMYYGTEAGLTGGGTKSNRKCMPWNEIDSGVHNEFIDKIKKLVNLRKSNESLRGKELAWIETGDNRVVHYIRGNVEVIINGSDDSIKNVNKAEILFFNNCEADKIKPNGVLILRKN